MQKPRSEPGPSLGMMVLLGSLTAFGPLAVDMYLPALPAIGRSLSVSSSATQSSMASFLAGMAVGQFLYGTTSDRFGRRPVLFVGMAVFLLGSVACAIAGSFDLLLAARFLQALGACAGGVVARAVVRDCYGHTETARVLSAMMLVTGLAPIFAPLIGGALLTVSGWRAIFWLLAGFGALVTVAAFLTLPETRSAEAAAHARGDSPGGAYLALMRKPALIGYVLAGAMNGATIFTYISASPELLITYYEIPAAHFGWVFSINAVGLVIAGQVNRRLLKGRSTETVLKGASLVAVAVAAALVATALFAPREAWLVLVLLFALVSSYGFLQGNALASALSTDPLRGGAVSAVFGAMSFATGAAASAVTAAFHDGTPRTMAWVILAATMGSALALYLLATRRAAD